MPGSLGISQPSGKPVLSTLSARLRLEVRAVGRLFVYSTLTMSLGLAWASAQPAPADISAHPFSITDGKVTLAVSREQLGAEPNGIALSPDDKYLYLSAGTMSPDPKIMRYPVRADGSVGRGELFTHGPGIGDGMKTDRAGNIWSTQPVPGTVRITSPAGKLLGLLHLPTLGDAEPRKSACASSLAFGGDDAKTLYVAACEYIYAIQLRAPGILQGPAH